MEVSKTGILAFEDNKSLRENYAELFRWDENFYFIAAMPNANKALECVEKYTPGLILMDIDMPGVSGLEALRQIKNYYSHIPVVMLTVFENNENILESIKAGADGYILKQDVLQLPEVLLQILQGGAPLTGIVAKKILGIISIPKDTHAPANLQALTSREGQVLELLADGNSYKMIANRMAISIETVRSYIKQVYKKLNVNSATEAIKKFKG